jgi:2-methylcitrate dehydratase PrpD
MKPKPEAHRHLGKQGHENMPPDNVWSKTISESLAEFCVKLRWGDLPENVIRYAKLLFLDLIGAALAGVETAEVKSSIAAVKVFGSVSGPSTLWGTALHSAPAHAAFINGIAAHAQELDDFGGVDHSGAVVVPALLAIGEALPPVTGKRLLEAMVVGYEVGRRVLEAAGGYRAHNNASGWHSTGTCGSFGAAAAVSKVLGMDARKTTWAIGLAGTFTGGTWAFIKDGAMSKRYHAGRAAETGVVSACLARSGFTGPSYIFEADWGGFFQTYAKGQAEPAKLTEDLGRNFKIMRSGIKPYASCRDIHSTLDVVLDARRDHGLRPEDIDHVEVRCIPEMNQMLGEKALPSTRLDAQLSLPYSVAVALAAGHASLAEYGEPWLSDPSVRALAQRVSLVVDPGLPFDSEPHVSIVAHDGRVIQGHVDFARGAPQNPLSQIEVEEKFERLASMVLPPSQVQELKQMVSSMEGLEDIRAITRLLVRSN